MFEKPQFLADVRQMPPGSKINWSKSASDYQLKNKQGNVPRNGGQVLLEFARANGVAVDGFNPDKNVSGRGSFCRIRVPIKKITVDNHINLSVSELQDELDKHEY